MSVYPTSSGKNLLNISTNLNGIDVNTRNEFNATIVGFKAGVVNRGLLNVLVGFQAGNAVTIGMNNTMIGGNAGQKAIGTDNVLVGTNTGAGMRFGSRNILLGSGTGRNLQGNNNILIGNANTSGAANANNNIALGATQFITGDANITLGQLNRVNTTNSISFGNQQNNVGANSIIMGNLMTNTGSNAFIVNSYGSYGLSNNNRNLYTNINNFLDNYVVPSAGSNNTFTRLAGTLVTVDSSVFKVKGITEFTDHIRCKTIEVSSNVTLPVLHFTQSNSVPPHWSAYLEPSLTSTDESGSNCSDLVFKSVHGTYVTFTDEFASEVLNFTGKHRCAVRPGDDIDAYTNYLGRIVSSCGVYHGLDGSTRPSLDESVPRVRLCTMAYDSKAFGVVGAVEEAGVPRNFKVGNMQFMSTRLHNRLPNRLPNRVHNQMPIQTPTQSFTQSPFSTATDVCEDERKLIVHAHGEGGIWVCNINGNLRNGDLITSSGICGYGMRQNSDVCHSYTVAKITCDCDFNLRSTAYDCKPFKYNNMFLKKAFVGCIFKF
jgi:hypothetical protein